MKGKIHITLLFFLSSGLSASTGYVYGALPAEVSVENTGHCPNEPNEQCTTVKVDCEGLENLTLYSDDGRPDVHAPNRRGLGPRTRLRTNVGGASDSFGGHQVLTLSAS